MKEVALLYDGVGYFVMTKQISTIQQNRWLKRLGEVLRHGSQCQY